MIKQGIPYWRLVDYADDGCSVYQCLSCKYIWESRTSPKNYGGRYPDWTFCPVCGRKWEGEKKTPYLRGGKHQFVTKIYGLDYDGYARPTHRYQVLQWCEIRKKWGEVSDWFASNCDFYIVPVERIRGICGAYKVSSRYEALEKVSLIKFLKYFFKSGRMKTVIQSRHGV